MKKKLVFMALFMSVILSGCGKISEEAQSVIDKIDALEEELTYTDKARVDEIVQVYSTLTDEQKSEVKNYDRLEEAQNKIHDYWMNHPFEMFKVGWDCKSDVNYDDYGIIRYDGVDRKKITVHCEEKDERFFWMS